MKSMSSQIIEITNTRTDSNKMTIEFFYMTSTGCKWLNEIIKVNSKKEAIEAAERYFMETYSASKSLLNHWHKEGEDVSMFIDFDILEIEYDKTGVTLALAREFDDLDDPRE